MVRTRGSIMLLLLPLLQLLMLLLRPGATQTNPWLSSGKCGPSHLLPFGSPAQCNPMGKYPCCQLTSGWCGITPSHCTCTGCIDYRKSRSPSLDTANSPASDISPPKLPYRCGELSPNRSLSGHHRVRRIIKKNLPWVALLGETQKSSGETMWFCGGSLIDTQWVLTAAHCFKQRNATIVRLGAFDLNNNSTYQDEKVAEVIIHPSYRLPVAYQDIALIKLNNPVQFKDTIGPICLPWGTAERTRNMTGEELLVAGWGAQYFGGELSSILLEAKLTVFDMGVCDRSYSQLHDYKYRYPESIDQETLCVGDPTDRGRDACEGDSGGGAVRMGHNGYVIEGIVSLGNGCGKRNFPGLYIRVKCRLNLSWIKSVAFAGYPSLPDITTVIHKPSGGNSAPGSSNSKIERRGCGKIHYKGNRTNRVRRITRNHWPWLALLAYFIKSEINNENANSSFRCSGSLIDDQWVLTSAFCLHLHGFDLRYVRLGENNIGSSTDGRHEDVDIAEIFKHPKFESKSLQYDVGLIKLKRKVQFRDMVSPVCLPLGTEDTNIHSGAKVIAAGFGANAYPPTNLGDIVLDVELVVMELSLCQTIYTDQTISPDMLCIGDPTDRGQDTCQGDAGAPVVRKVGGSYVVEGIVSFGIGCGMKDTPAVYSRVDHPTTLQWIKRLTFIDSSS